MKQPNITRVLSQYRQEMNGCRELLQRTKDTAKYHHSMQRFSHWSQAMQRCKRLKKRLATLAAMVQFLLQTLGATRFYKKVEITTKELEYALAWRSELPVFLQRQAS